MPPLTLNSLNTMTLALSLTALTQAGCSRAQETAAGTAGLMAVGMVAGYSTRRWPQERASGTSPREMIPPVFERARFEALQPVDPTLPEPPLPGPPPPAPYPNEASFRRTQMAPLQPIYPPSLSPAWSAPVVPQPNGALPPWLGNAAPRVAPVSFNTPLVRVEPLPAPSPVDRKIGARHVEEWVREVFGGNQVVSVEETSGAFRVRIKANRSTEFGILKLNLPRQATEQAVRCVSDFLNKHCHLFREAGHPTMDVNIRWGDQGRQILFHGVRNPSRIAAEDLANKYGIPWVDIFLPFDPEPSGQVVRMIDQLRDAFREIRKELKAVKAGWDLIDPMAGIFDEI